MSSTKDQNDWQDKLRNNINKLRQQKIAHDKTKSFNSFSFPENHCSKEEIDFLLEEIKNWSHITKEEENNTFIINLTDGYIGK